MHQASVVFFLFAFQMSTRGNRDDSDDELGFFVEMLHNHSKRRGFNLKAKWSTGHINLHLRVVACKNCQNTIGIAPQYPLPQALRPEGLFTFPGNYAKLVVLIRHEAIYVYVSGSKNITRVLHRAVV
jgi:hypothetical protein